MARVASKMKTTPDLIMRMNNMNGTMLRIGERLMISHPDFSLFIQRNERVVVLLDHGQFFKRYHVQNVKLPGRQAAENQHARWRDYGVEKRETRRVREQGIPKQHALDSAGSATVTLYTPEASGGVLPPPQGLQMEARDLVELSTLVNNKTPATITD